MVGSRSKLRDGRLAATEASRFQGLSGVHEAMVRERRVESTDMGKVAGATWWPLPVSAAELRDPR